MRKRLSKAISNPSILLPYLWRKIKLATWWRYYNNTKQIAVNDITAEFITGSRHDYRIIHDISERDVLLDVLSNLHSNHVFWDVGSNIGLYSCFAGNLDIDIVAIEPDNHILPVLKQNLQINNIDATVLSYSLNNEKDQLSEDLNSERDPSKTEFKALPGDRIVSKNMVPKPTVLKIDIEGMEYSALCGMSRVIKDVRLIYVEIHPKKLEQRGDSQSDVEELLQSYGFALTVVQPFDGGNLIVRGMRT